MKASNSSQSFFLQAKKSLGQNFLKDTSVIDKICSFIHDLCIKHKINNIHEIGPGSGALTRQLLHCGVPILAIEKDKRAIEGLQETLAVEFPDKLTLLEYDILKYTPDVSLSGELPFCVGNIPYYITSDILFWFTNHKSYYSHGVFLVQKEVADRLVAKPGTKEYSRLSVKIQLNFDVKKLFLVPASSFIPVPKVDSTFIHLVPKRAFFLVAEEEKKFETFCAMLFSARRKMLRRVLQAQRNQWDDLSECAFWSKLKDFSIQEDTRPDAISPENILGLYHTLQSVKVSSS